MSMSSEIDSMESNENEGKLGRTFDNGNDSIKMINKATFFNTTMK